MTTPALAPAPKLCQSCFMRPATHVIQGKRRAALRCGLCFAKLAPPAFGRAAAKVGQK